MKRVQRGSSAALLLVALTLAALAGCAPSYPVEERLDDHTWLEYEGSHGRIVEN